MVDLNQLEWDSLLGAAFGLGAAVTLGIVGSLTALGVDLTATQSVGGISLANSSIISILALGGVIAVNVPDLDSMRTETQILAVATLGIVGVGALSPETLTFATYEQSPILALAFFSVESGGFWALATSR